MADWLAAPDALNAIFRATHSTRVDADLRLHLRTGVVRARAAALSIPALDLVSHAPTMLEPSFWSDESAALIRRSNPIAGFFVGVVQRGDRWLEAQAAGVTFNADDLSCVLGAAQSSVKQGGNKRDAPKGGAPRESAKWDAVTIALVRIANDGRLDKKTPELFVGSQSALRALVLDDPAVTAVGDVKDETIKPLIRRVWQEIVEGN